MMPTEGLASCHELLRDTEESDDVVPLQVDALAPVPADDLSPSLAGLDVTRVRCANV
jgi:hypothetical protein